jgi:hypothetical protein
LEISSLLLKKTPPHKHREWRFNTFVNRQFLQHLCEQASVSGSPFLVRVTALRRFRLQVAANQPTRPTHLNELFFDPGIDALPDVMGEEKVRTWLMAINTGAALL